MLVDIRSKLPSKNEATNDLKPERRAPLGLEKALQENGIDTQLDGAKRSLSIQGLPAGGRLSLGTNRGDGAWSLSLADAPQAYFIPPPNSDKSYRLTVRLIGMDDDGLGIGTTIGLFEIEVGPASDDLEGEVTGAQMEEALAKARTEWEAAESERLAEESERWQSEEAERVRALEDTFKTEAERRLEAARATWEAETNDRLVSQESAGRAETEELLARAETKWRSEEIERRRKAAEEQKKYEEQRLTAEKQRWRAEVDELVRELEDSWNTKITQRLPVWIAIAQHEQKLRPGMMVEVRIDVRGR